MSLRDQRQHAHRERLRWLRQFERDIDREKGADEHQRAAAALGVEDHLPPPQSQLDLSDQA